MQHELKDGKPINTVDDPTKEYEFKTCIRPSKEDESPIPRDTRPLEIKESMCVEYIHIFLTPVLIVCIIYTEAADLAACFVGCCSPGEFIGGACPTLCQL